MEVGTMLKSLTNVMVWVQDQDEALAFYTEKLGLELRDDVTVPELGNFRWLTVGVPGQPDGQPAEVAQLGHGDVVAELEAEFLGVERERLVLVVDPDLHVC